MWDVKTKAATEIYTHCPTLSLQDALPSYISVRLGGGINSWRRAIGCHGWPAERSRSKLAANAVHHRFVLRPAAHGLDDLGLFRPNGIGLAGVGRLHRGHREKLEHMVGHHVPQPAGGIVEAHAMLAADRLGGRDLQAMDMVAIPYRMVQAVGEERTQRIGKT